MHGVFPGHVCGPAHIWCEVCDGLSADDRTEVGAFPGTVELAEPDALPRSEHETALRYGHHHRGADKGGFQVGSRVALGVAEP